MELVPRKVFFTKGVGRHVFKLHSFELALRAAGIERCNIVRVSSIFPPRCEVISAEEGIRQLKPGQITYCVLSECSTNEAERLIGAAVGVAMPADSDHYGYISEYHGYGESDREMADYVEDLACAMLGSTLGIDVDPNTAYDERKEIYRMSGKIVYSDSVACIARGNGEWTTTIAVAVFLF